MQHLWAELSEKSSDVLDPTIKYGGGPDEWRTSLASCSDVVAHYEESEEQLSKNIEMTFAIRSNLNKASLELLEHEHGPSDHKAQERRVILEDWTRKLEYLEKENHERQRELACIWDMIVDNLKAANSWLDDYKGQKQ